MSFGTYPNLVNATSAGAKTEVNALLSTLLTLIPDGGGASPQDGNVSGNLPPNAGGTPTTTTGAPDFGQIHPDVANKLRAEVVAIQAAITAGA